MRYVNCPLCGSAYAGTGHECPPGLRRRSSIEFPPDVTISACETRTNRTAVTTPHGLFVWEVSTATGHGRTMAAWRSRDVRVESDGRSGTVGAQ